VRNEHDGELLFAELVEALKETADLAKEGLKPFLNSGGQFFLKSFVLANWGQPISPV
jgi:hypothetical protein